MSLSYSLVLRFDTFLVGKGTKLWSRRDMFPFLVCFAAFIMARKGAARMQLRVEVLALYRSGITNQHEIARRLKASQSTIRCILKRWAGSADASAPVDSPRKGRPSLSTPRYPELPRVPDGFFFCRFRRSIVRLAEKHPFWSATRLVRFMHARLVDAMNNRPAGVVVEVSNIFVTVCAFSDPMAS